MALRPRIVIAFPFAPEHLERMRAAAGDAFELVSVDPADPAALDAAVGAGCVAMVAQRRPSAGVTTPDLRWHQALSAGVEHLLRVGPWPEGVTLTNAKGVYAIPIAQYVLAAILRVCEGTSRRDALQARREWPDPVDPFVGIPVRGRTLVVVGYGGIGRETARVAAALGMRILAVTARPERRIADAVLVPGTGDPEGIIPERIVGLDGLHAALAEADFVSLSVPLTPASRGLIDAAALGRMRPDAWIINTGRGPVIEEADLLAALHAGRLGGAVLDVFAEEPLPPDSPWWDAPNVIITPHVSGADSPGPLSEVVIQNLERFRAGRPLINVVDLARGY
jgi:phosphoglycerate dehydrogenase-like enzyme